MSAPAIPIPEIDQVEPATEARASDEAPGARRGSWFVRITVVVGFKIDLEMAEDELYRETETNCRARDGFKPIEEWRADISKKIAASLAAQND